MYRRLVERLEEVGVSPDRPSPPGGWAFSYEQGTPVRDFVKSFGTPVRDFVKSLLLLLNGVCLYPDTRR